MKILAIFILLLNLTGSAFSQDINWDRLTVAIIEVESGGDPNAYSGYAFGLMQISPIVLKEYELNTIGQYPNIGDLYNPAINVTIGEWYIQRLYHYYKCTTLVDILSSYNGGITRWNKCGRDLKKMPRETQSYVLKVMRIYNKR